jgi:uncharacterized ParB-like nuclease family protein
MAQALLGGLLPAIYSGADQLKRGVYGLLTNPMQSIDNTASGLIGSRLQRQDLMNQAFANPDRPFQVTNQNALGQLGENVLTGELGIAPIGMTKLNKTLVNIPISSIEHGESAMKGGKLTFPSAKDTIKEYAERPTDFPPIDVVSNDIGSKIPFMVADGSHRLEAAKLRGQTTIPAYISPYDAEGLELAKQIQPQGLLDTSYRGSHTAPDARVYGARLDDLTTLMPQDVYSQQGKRLYGIGNPKIDSEWYVAALRAKNKPDAEIEIFRAVPKGVKDINDGDWITTSKTYANWHGENVLNGEYDLISKKVKAKTLSSEGYPYEFGYNPE